jgi:hypothetical protein
MINSENRIAVMFDLHKSGSHGCITDRDRAKMGLDVLIAARELFKAADNKRTVARIEAAISSARGAVRIQAGREARALYEQQRAADWSAIKKRVHARDGEPTVPVQDWNCKRRGMHRGPCNDHLCKPREAKRA